MQDRRHMICPDCFRGERQMVIINIYQRKLQIHATESATFSRNYDYFCDGCVLVLGKITYSIFKYYIL